MYKAEAELFLSANNNISYAKTLINECKRLISEAELPNNSDYANCKKCITDCNIGGLVELVENTKESLFQIDSQFATEYMTLLQEYMQTDTIDLSNMSDEEKMQYSIQMDSYMRDYNYNLLYMLEKYENSGQLTGEMKQQLDIQRLIVKQYGIQDEMAGLVPTSDEYIRLFNMNASIDMTLISSNQSLTAEQKKAALESYEQNYNASLEILELNRDISLLEEELKSAEYGSEAYYEIENEIKNLQIDYLEGKENLTAEEQKQLDFLYQGVELNDLYIAQEQNNGFFHPFVENELDEAILDQKISMGIATEDEIAYDQMNVFERTWEDTKTAVVSTVFGIGSVTETLVDGTVMLAGNVGSWFGADTQWAEDFVSIAYATDAYDGIVLADGINSVAAYSDVHTYSNMLGNTVGYVSLTLLPGGKVTTAITGGLSAAGSSTERALLSGASWEEASWVGAISGTLGAVTGYGVGGGLTSGAQSWGQVVGKTFLGAGISTIEPIVNTGAEYFIYANDMVDDNGNKVYDNILDYYVEGGGLTNTVMAFASGMLSSGIESYKGYNSYQKMVSFYASQQAISDLDNFFEQYRTDLFGYGADQHIGANIIPANNNMSNFGEFQRLRNKLMNMGMSSNDAVLLLSQIDNAGACSYASLVNEIFSIYRYDSAAFEAVFGFPMYTNLDNGAQVLNSAELLTDIYMHANHVNNGGHLLYYDIDGSLKVDNNIMIDRNLLGDINVGQQYMALGDFRSDALIDSYLKSKSPYLSYTSVTAVSTINKMYDVNPSPMSQVELDRMKGAIDYYLNNGYPVSISYYQYNGSKHSITMYNLDGGPNMNTKYWNEGLSGNNVSGHSVYITASNDNGIFVSSWGRKYFISYDELKYMPFGITASTIKYN